tara:strand:- start:706 stop:927 length:222 start_codon:yes stop_codon:yes gene_type:complete
MTNKNPFEIRADILGMAKEYLDEQYRVNMDMSQKLFEVGSKTAEELQVAMKPYTMQQLTETAENMYNFVQKKN